SAITRTNAPRHLIPIHRFHGAIGNDDVRPFRREGGKTPFAILRKDDVFDPHGTKKSIKQPPHFGAVLNDENLQAVEKFRCRLCRFFCHPAALMLSRFAAISFSSASSVSVEIVLSVPGLSNVSQMASTWKRITVLSCLPWPPCSR